MIIMSVVWIIYVQFSLDFSARFCMTKPASFLHPLLSWFQLVKPQLYKQVSQIQHRLDTSAHLNALIKSSELHKGQEALSKV